MDASPHDTAYTDISAALQNYFDGFYECDLDKLKAVFHPNCHLFSATEGPLTDDDMDTVYARVQGRTPPASVGQERHDRILSIDNSGPESALAKVQIGIADRLFTDYLSMLRIDGEWRIISKTYTFVPIAQARAQAAE